MPVDPAVRALLDEWGEADEFDLVAARAQMDAWQVPAAELPVGVAISASEIAGVPVRIYRPDHRGRTKPPHAGKSTPANAERAPTVVWCHGGGFVLGTAAVSDPLGCLFASRLGWPVVSVDYRLAPEHPFPAGFEDCLAATQWAAANIESLGGDLERLAVSGDSAGGNLSAAVALATKDDGPKLAAQLLLYPGVDFREDDDLHPSRLENGEGLFLTAEDMRWFRNHYLHDDAHTNDPRASVLLAPDLTGLPPAVVGTGEYDPLRDEGEAYAAALEAAGVKVVLRRYDGLIHGFFGMGTWSPASAAAAKDLCEELRAVLG